MGGLCFALAVALIAHDPPAAPQAPPNAEAARDAPRLKIDLQRHIDEAYERHAASDLPRFEERVEVRDRAQEALDQSLAGIDEQCDEAESGPPNHAELNRYRTNPVPVHWDYLAAAKFVFKTIKSRFGSKEPRWFIYAVRSPAAAADPSEQPELVLREGALSDSVRTSVPGTSWELVASFHSREDALLGLTRLRQGFVSLRRAYPDDRAPPWANTNCRPRRK